MRCDVGLYFQVRLQCDEHGFRRRDASTARKSATFLIKARRSYLQARQSFKLISAFCNASPAAGGFSTPPSSDWIPTCARSRASPALPSDAFAGVVRVGKVSVGGSAAVLGLAEMATS